MFYLFWRMNEKHSIFCQKRGLSDLHCKCRYEFFEEKKFCRKKIQLDFRNLIEFVFSRLAKFPWQSCEHCILHVNSKFRDEIFLGKKHIFCYFSRTFGEKFSAFFELAPQANSEKEIVIIFEHLGKNYSGFLDLFTRVVKTAFYVSMGTFWGKSFVFWEFFLHISWTLSETFLAFC